MSLKKSQSSLEFLLIFVFIFIIISLVMASIGKISLDLSKDRVEGQIENFATSIQTEAALLEKSQSGYYREYEIPKSILIEYDVTVDDTYLILSPTEKISENRNFYYSLPGNNSIQLLREDRDGDLKNETYLILKKNIIENFDGLRFNDDNN